MKTIKYILLFIASFSIVKGKSQSEISLFQMHDVIQSISLNPAVSSKSKVVIGLPALNSKMVALSAPVSFNDFASGDDRINAHDLLTPLKDKNRMMSKVAANLFTLGIGGSKSYWQFTIDQKVNAYSTFSRNIFDVLLEGNGAHIGETIDGQISFDAIAYTEVALGYSRDLGNGLRIGVRPKLLIGNVGFQSSDNHFTFYTNPNDYSLTVASKIDARASIPGKVTLDENGVIDDLDVGEASFGDFFSNKGFGLDLGVVKDWGSGLRLSASLLDMGSIRWKQNTHRMWQDTEVEYDGGIKKGIDSWRAFSDTLESLTKLQYEEGKPFSQKLSPRLMAGVSYPVLSKLRVGGSFTTEFGPGGYKPWAISATAFTEGVKLLSLGLSYTITNNSAFNIGTVTAFHLGAFELYLISDNILSAIRPFHQKNFHVNFGMNFRFGQRNSSKPTKEENTIPIEKLNPTKEKIEEIGNNEE